MSDFIFVCEYCHYLRSIHEVSPLCPRCRKMTLYYPKISFDFRTLLDSLSWETANGIWAFSSLLPPIKEHLSLGEGFTPLQKFRQLFSDLDILFYIKKENLNPTGSFRDRAAAIMVSHALSLGYSKILCASDGNLGASIAAYASAAGMQATCVVPSNILLGKYAQISAYGAKISEIKGTLQQAIQDGFQRCLNSDYYPATAEHNFLSIEGQKTISFELYIQMKSLVQDDLRKLGLVIPLGSGSLMFSVMKGFLELKEMNVINTLPHIFGVHLTKSHESVQTAIFEPHDNFALMPLEKIQSPYFEQSLKQLPQFSGTLVEVSHDEVLKTSKDVARSEGLFIEPASAIVIAAIPKILNNKYYKENMPLIGIITSSGLKSQNLTEQTFNQGKIDATFLLKRHSSIKFKILEFLDDHPGSHGYFIWKHIGKGKITRQAVYQHLKELEEKKWISRSTTTANGRKIAVFRLTKKGHTLLKLIKEL